MAAPEVRETKAARREAARQEARALREAQARREKRNRLILIAVIVAVATLIGVTAAVLIGQAGRTLDDVAAPAGADASGGIVVGQAGVGEPTPDAPVVRVYSDFMCPFCAQFELTNGPMLEELIDSGEATVAYHPVAYLDRFSEGTRYSTRAMHAAAVVADEAPEQFVAFWLAMFANQPPENTPGLSDDEIALVALEAGVPAEVVGSLADGRFDEWVEAATDQATRDLPRPATPTVLVDGEVFEGDWRDPANLRAAIVG